MRVQVAQRWLYPAVQGPPTEGSDQDIPWESPLSLPLPLPRRPITLGHIPEVEPPEDPPPDPLTQQRWEMPEYPVWMPPVEYLLADIERDDVTYFFDGSHTLPIWLPWRPRPERELIRDDPEPQLDIQWFTELSLPLPKPVRQQPKTYIIPEEDGEEEYFWGVMDLPVYPPPWIERKMHRMDPEPIPDIPGVTATFYEPMFVPRFTEPHIITRSPQLYEFEEDVPPPEVVPDLADECFKPCLRRVDRKC